MISQSTRFAKEISARLETKGFPPVVRRSYERARDLQEKFASLISEAQIELPHESCICLSGSVSRLESVNDSDIDYVLLWDDYHSPNSDAAKERAKARGAVSKINNLLARKLLRPCDSFSCERPLSELTSTESMFSRYSILTLVDSSFVAGNAESYETSLNTIRSALEGYAIGISAETQVIRTLIWYTQREGWIDQLHYGTSVNRFSRLIQLFSTILSISEFGIGETRKTRTTWLRISRLEPFLASETFESLCSLWVKALELKETRAARPMLSDSGFTGISKIIELWKELVAISQAPLLY